MMDIFVTPNLEPHHSSIFILPVCAEWAQGPTAIEFFDGDPDTCHCFLKHGLTCFLRSHQFLPLAKLQRFTNIYLFLTAWARCCVKVLQNLDSPCLRHCSLKAPGSLQSYFWRQSCLRGSHSVRSSYLGGRGACCWSSWGGQACC